MSGFRLAAALFVSTAAALAQSPPAPAPDPAPRAAPPADIDVTRDEARQTATDLAQKLEDDYVFPEIAHRYAAMLRANAASGAYDGIASGRALAERLTADLRAVSPDAHLRVRVAPAMRPPPPDGQKPATAKMRPAFPWKPIEEARWLAPGIAYIRFNVFPGDPETVAAARRFMIDHATARVIIFDNRTHHGGGLAEMNAMFPYLFAKPTTLVTMDTRASVDRADHDPHPMERLVPGPAGVVRREHYVLPSKTEKRLFKARVFVLTSGATGSAAEHMTLALKHTRRATIVGEPTAGAGHYGGEERIGEHFRAFVPVGRSSDPDTGKDWEGVGVEPDVAVPAEQALTEALVLSGLARPEAERISATVKPSLPMTRRLPRVLPPGGHGI
ncbi:MAG TPA: S41 family peptidase [Allosphingosinicella sp.]|nr:S41 family peptidase [Allosphingosinicella sp.]